MNRAASSLALLCLLGCASTTPATIETSVAVPVPCVVPAVQKPAYAFDSVPADADLFVMVRALLATIEQMDAYEQRLEAALASCS